MTVHAGVIINTTIGTFHPVWLKCSPRPSEHNDKIVRHKSGGHHTVGFKTMPAALKWIEAMKGWQDSGTRLSWDGTGVPSFTVMLPRLDVQDG